MNIFNLFGIIDVVIVLSVILFIVLGWKSGFLLKIVDFASSIFGLIASLLLARPFSKVLDNWFGESIAERIDAYMLERISSADIAASETNIRAAFEGMSLPDFIVDWIVNSISTEEAMQSILEVITPLVKSLVLLFFAFLVLFFGSMIVFFLLKILAKMITSIPVIKQIDKFLGAIFGLFKISVLIFVLLFMLGLVITVPAVNNAIGDFLQVDMQLQSENFRLSKWLYDNNVLKYIINVFAVIF